MGESTENPNHGDEASQEQWGRILQKVYDEHPERRPIVPEIKNSPGINYRVEKGKRNFEVWQREVLPYMNFSPRCTFDEATYRYLHAFSIAETLAFLRMGNFPGMPGDIHSANAEYAASRSAPGRAVRDLVEDNYLTNRNVVWMDIGGQQGKFIGNSIGPTETIKRRLGLSGRYVLDLDIQRRPFPPESYSDSENLTYIEGDAHELKDIDVPELDLVTMINLTDVLFDPVSVMAQAWDKLSLGGVLLVGDTFLNIKYSPFYRRDEECLPVVFDRWQQSLAMVTRAVNQADKLNFRYREKVTRGDVEKGYPQIKSVAQAIHGIAPRESGVEHNMISDLGRLCPHTQHAYQRNIQNAESAYSDFTGIAIRREEGDSNPFAGLEILGLSQNPYHLGEYTFPQVIREIS